MDWNLENSTVKWVIFRLLIIPLRVGFRKFKFLNLKTDQNLQRTKTKITSFTEKEKRRRGTVFHKTCPKFIIQIKGGKCAYN